jgi:hypothetical protein
MSVWIPILYSFRAVGDHGPGVAKVTLRLEATNRPVACV